MKDKQKPSLDSGVAFLFVIIRVNGSRLPVFYSP